MNDAKMRTRLDDIDFGEADTVTIRLGSQHFRVTARNGRLEVWSDSPLRIEPKVQNVITLWSES